MQDDMNFQETNIQEDDEIVTLSYDDGTEADFYVMAELDYEDKWYCYLQPVKTSDEFDEDELLIYEIAFDEDENEIFLPIDDEELIGKLINMLNEELKD